MTKKEFQIQRAHGTSGISMMIILLKKKYILQFTIPKGFMSPIMKERFEEYVNQMIFDWIEGQLDD